MRISTVAAHYGHNRERNRIVRQDTPQARKEQEDELKEALLLQNIQQQLREQQLAFHFVQAIFGKNKF